MIRIGFVSLVGFALCAMQFASGTALADDPLMGRSPWNFTPQNRAAIAIAIKNAEDPGSGGSSGPGAIVCGGNSGASGQGAAGSSSGATANSSCIIINNSDGAIITNPQTSEGDQNASSSTQTQSNTTKSKSIDEVSAILGGNKQGL